MHLHDMHNCKSLLYHVGEVLGVKFSHGHARKASNLKSRKPFSLEERATSMRN